MEEQQNEQNNQLLLPFVVMHSKLNKHQIQQINLESLMKQYLIKMNLGINFRECSQQLQHFAIFYLKQHQYLKQEIGNLQNSMVSIEKKNSDNLKQRKKKSDQVRHQDKDDADFPISQSHFCQTDQVRNIVQADKLSLNQLERPSLSMKDLLNQNSLHEPILAIQHQLKDLSIIQRQSLKEIIQQRKKNNIRSFDQYSNLPQILIKKNVEEIQNGNTESIGILTEDENLINIDNKSDNNALGQFCLQIEEKTCNDIIKQTKKRKKENKAKHLLFDEFINDNYEEKYKRNIETFTKHNHKIDELQFKMSALSAEPDFWNSKDDLSILINQLQISTNENQISSEQNNVEQEVNVTTEHFQNQYVDDLFHWQSEISEFNEKEIKNSSKNNKNNSLNIYQDCIVSLRIAQGEQANINKYFQYCERSNLTKVKSFYDLLILTKIGQITIDQLKDNQLDFPQILLSAGSKSI